MNNIILRRRKLGISSGKGIEKYSTTGIKEIRNWRDNMPEDLGWVFRWGCTSTIDGGKIVNSSKAIHRVSDKLGFRMTLANYHLCQPTTTDRKRVYHWLDIDGKSVVVRTAKHSRGRGMWLVAPGQPLPAIMVKPGREWYASHLVDKVAEYRVCVVSGRVVWVANKIPANPHAVAWNVAKGGRFENVRWEDWPLKAVRVACEAFDISGLDFGGVDVMVDEGGMVYVLEINSAPSLTSPYRQECMAKAFDWIVKRNGAENIKRKPERGGWKKFIHPALTDKAELL